MQHKMRYRLGLDLGTTSIGWAMLRLNEHDEPCAVIKMGTRIFSDGRDPKDGSSLAVTRRLARQMRRRRDRLLKRKARLQAALVRLGVLIHPPCKDEATYAAGTTATAVAQPVGTGRSAAAGTRLGGAVLSIQAMTVPCR